MTESPIQRPEVNPMTHATQRPTVNVPVAGVGRGAAGSGPPAPSPAQVVFRLEDVSVFYGAYEAVRHTTMDIGKNQITAMIGPSGCGKSTILRSLNRMNDLIPGARVGGSVTFHGTDLYSPEVDPIM